MNKYIQDPNNPADTVLKIYSGHGVVDVLVSTSDVPNLQKHGWYISGLNSGGYRYIRATIKQKKVEIHTFLMGNTYSQDKKVTDHINHNTLDNRRQNLRKITRSHNSFNRRGLTGITKTGNGYYYQGFISKESTKETARFPQTEQGLIDAWTWRRNKELELYQETNKDQNPPDELFIKFNQTRSAP